MDASTSSAEANARRIGIAVAIAFHAAIIAALLSYVPVRSALLAAAPVMVSYMVTPAVEQPTEPPRSLPVKVQHPLPPRPVEPAPLLAITTDAPTAATAPVPEVVEPLPPIQETAPAPPVAAPLPPPITPPNFNAAYLDNPPPMYPALARRYREQGRVLLRVFVAAAGTPETVDVRTSSGSPRLDNAALETVRRWRFVPARQGDQPVAAWVLVPISFTLEN